MESSDGSGSGFSRSGSGQVAFIFEILAVSQTSLLVTSTLSTTLMMKSSKMSHRFETFGQKMRRTRVPNAALEWSTTSSHMMERNLREKEDISSWFCASLIKWSELDLSAPFQHFMRRVKPYTLSLLTVVHNRRDIFEACKALLNASDNEKNDDDDDDDDLVEEESHRSKSVSSSSARYEPAMELVASLARDLQSSFLPFFPDFVKLSMDAFSVQSAESIRSASFALSEVLRILQRQRVSVDLKDTDPNDASNEATPTSTLSMMRVVVDAYVSHISVLDASQIFVAHALADVVKRASSNDKDSSDLASETKTSVHSSTTMLPTDQGTLVQYLVEMLTNSRCAPKERRRLTCLSSKILVLCSKSQVLRSSRTKNGQLKSNNKLWSLILTAVHKKLGQLTLSEQWRSWEVLIDALIVLAKDDKVGNFESHQSQLLDHCLLNKQLPLAFKIIRQMLRTTNTTKDFNEESKNQRLAVKFVDDILKSDAIDLIGIDILVDTLKTCLLSEDLQVRSDNLQLISSLLQKSKLEIVSKAKVFAQVVNEDSKLGAASLSSFRDFTQSLSNSKCCSKECLVYLAQGITAVSSSMERQWNTSFVFEMGHRDRHFLPDSMVRAATDVFEDLEVETQEEINALLQGLSFLRPLNEQLVEKMIVTGQKWLFNHHEMHKELSKSTEFNKTINLLYNAAAKVLEPTRLLPLVDLHLVRHVAVVACLITNDHKKDTEEAERVTTSLLTLSLSTLLCISDLNCSSSSSSSSVLSFLHGNLSLLSLLSHHEPIVRLHASRLLLSLGSISKSSESLIFTVLEAEAVELAVHTYRDRLRLLEVAKQRIINETVIEERTIDMVVRLMLGNMLSNFAYLRAPLKSMIGDLWPKHREVIWIVFEQVLHRLVADNETMRLRQVLELLQESMIDGLGPERAAVVVDVFVSKYSEQMKHNRKLCVAFFTAFAKMSNLHNVRGFSSLLSASYSMLTWGLDMSSQLSSLSFLSSSFRSVKRVQSELAELTEKATWKTRLIKTTTDSEELSKIVDDSRTKSVAIHLLVGLLRRSCKLKRQRRRDARRFLLEHCATISQDFLMLVLKTLIEDDDLNVELALEVSVVSCSFITIDLHRGQVASHIVGLLNKLLKVETKDEKRVDSKLRTKMLNRLIDLFNAVPNFLIGATDDDDHKDDGQCHLKALLHSCLVRVLIWPIEDSNVVPRSIKTSPKMLKLLDLWLTEPKLQSCFFLKDSHNTSIVETVVRQFIESDKFELTFVNKIVDRVCNLINIKIQTDDDITGLDGMFLFLGEHLMAWLASKRKRRGVKVGSKLMVSSRLSVLKFVLQHDLLQLKGGEVEKGFLDLCHLAPKAIEGSLAEFFGLLQLWFDILDGKSVKESHQESIRKPTPEVVFELLGIVKEMHYKDKLCSILLERLGLCGEDHRLSSDPFFLVQSLDCLDRSSVVFALNLFLSHINGLDLGMTTPSLNALIMLLERIYVQGSEDYCQEIFTLVLKQVKKILGSREESAFGAAVAILQFLVKSGRLEALRDLEKLLGNSEGEEETDFFENIRHLQVHRRTRALRQLAAKLTKENDEHDDVEDNENDVSERKSSSLQSLTIGVTNMWSVLRPLASRFLFNETYKENSELIAASINVLASVGLSNGLNGYIRMLEQYIVMDPVNKKRRGKEKKEEEQQHDMSSSNKKPFVKQKFNMVSTLLSRFSFSASLTDDALKVRLRAIVRKLLRQTRSNGSSGGDHIEGHFSVYVAVVHFVVKHFEEHDSIKGCLNTIIIDLANKLKSREFRFRESVRSVLVRVIQTLGSTYLHHLFTVLQSTLTKGFQLHVLTDVYAKVLDNMKSEMKSEDADDLIGILLHYCSMELYSDLCSEKRIKLIRKRTPEASKTHAFAIVQTMASLISNDVEVLRSMLQPFLFISGQITLDKLEKSRNIIKSVIAGLTVNQKYSETQDLLVVAYGAMEDKLFEKSTDSKLNNMASNVLEVQVQLQREFAFALVLSAIRRAQNFDFEPMELFIKEAIKSVDNKEAQVLHDALRMLNMSVHNKPVMKAMHEAKLSHQVVKVIVTNLKKLCGARLKQHFNLCASILGALLREPSKFELFTPSLAKAVKSFFLASLEINTTQDDLTTPKMLISVLRHIPLKENRPLILRLCRMYVEADVGTAVVKQLQHLLTASSADVATVSLHFMLDNIDYDQVEGRRRVAQYIMDAVGNPSRFKHKASMLSRILFLVVNASVAEEATSLQQLFKTTIAEIMLRHFNNEADLSHLVLDVLVKWAESDKMVQKLVALKVALTAIEVANEENCESVAKFCVRMLSVVKVDFDLVNKHEETHNVKRRKESSPEESENNDENDMMDDFDANEPNGEENGVDGPSYDDVANTALKAYVLSLITHLLEMRKNEWVARVNEWATNFLATHKEHLVDIVLHTNANLRLKAINLLSLTLCLGKNDKDFWTSVCNDPKVASKGRKRKKQEQHVTPAWSMRLVANLFEILNHWLEETLANDDIEVLTDALLSLLYIDFEAYFNEIMRKSRMAIKQEKNEKPRDRTRRSALLTLMDTVINSEEFANINDERVENVLAVAMRNKGTEAGVQLLQRCEKRVGVEKYTQLVRSVNQSRSAAAAKKRKSTEGQRETISKALKKTLD